MPISKTWLRAAAAAAFLMALPGTAHAQLFFTDPEVERGPTEVTDPVITASLPGATAAEARAGMVWMLRSALNVAALQCQFSPYLRTVDNYNATLDHHSGELASAYTTLGNYFRRTLGARAGQSRFDVWSTAMYQEFSSLVGQMGFCQTASNVGKEALSRRKGQFYEVARDRLREIRSSLRSARDRIASGAPVRLEQVPASAFAAPDCSRLRGRELAACQAR